MTSDAGLEELSLDECLARLRSQSVGRIAFVTDEQLSVVPVNYRVVESSGQTPGKWLALRTRPGNFIERASVMVAFEIDGIDTARRAGWSVLVRGTLHHIDPDAASFRERFDSEPWITEDRESWLIVEPYSITGRQLRGGDAPDEWVFPARTDL
jgi:nitroimidazol reductase NimA-like FMN-containing flavoprotein (pyridoxamine 5'-phosphate oxidase superfamily)